MVFGMNNYVQKYLRIKTVLLLCCLLSDTMYGLDIKKQVAEELDQQLYGDKEVLDFEKIARRKLGKAYKPEYTDRHYQDYYTLPNWPYYSIFFYHTNFIQLTASFETASQAYSSSGKNENLAKLAFGEKPITIQEILLVSKLVALNKLVLPPVDPATAQMCPGLASSTVSPGDITCFGPSAGGSADLVTLTSCGYFLGALANQALTFDASERTYNVALNAARNFFKGAMSLGFHVPVVIKSHSLRLATQTIDCAIKSNIDCVDSANPGNVAVNFSQAYGTLSNFFDAILAAKCITFNHKNTQVALGDLSLFANFTIDSKMFTKCMAGGLLVIPTGKKRNASQLWPVDFGNGGFVELGIFGSMLWGHNKIWNPYIHAKLSGSFKADVSRRVPRIVTYAPTDQPSGVSPASQNINLILGSGVGLKSAADGGAFSFPDSTIRGFADSVQCIKLRPGIDFLLRLGNSFGRLPSKYGHLDVYYDLFLKGKTHASGGCDTSCSITTAGIWEANTYRVSHTAGLKYTYQWDEHGRFGLGGSYVFAGRNTPQTFGLGLEINIDF